MNLYMPWPDNRSALPVWPIGRTPSAQSSRLNAGALEEVWAAEELEWHFESKDAFVPDVTLWAQVICVNSKVSGSLFHCAERIELLPLRIGGADWLAANVLTALTGVCLQESDFWFLPPQELEVRWFNWINVVQPAASTPSAFHVVGGASTQTFVTQEFVDRYRGLSLKGLRFDLIGHVIADPSLAVPPPPPPTPRLSSSRRRQPQLSSKALPAADRSELDAAASEMRARLALAPGASPASVLESLGKEIERLRSGWFDRGKAEQVAALLGLSALLGEAIVKASGWTWVELHQGRDRRWVAVLSPTGQHALAPVPYVQRQIESAQAPTTTLLFNMIGSGSLPPGEPGQIVSIG